MVCRAFGDAQKGDVLFYQTFLRQTDYVAAKLAEAVYLGQTVEQDYTQVLQARQYAREAIRPLQEAPAGTV
ncbi:MAG: hypothetical protein VB023_07145 [Oscillibacter sp.]|nr:hypothetical protein [Oscillibacter sp.]